MLVRILADNPGPTFTRNLDAKFVSTFKDLLRHSQDPSLHQIARETLDALATEKQGDESLTPLRDMWLKEKERMSRAYSNVVRLQSCLARMGQAERRVRGWAARAPVVYLEMPFTSKTTLRRSPGQKASRLPRSWLDALKKLERRRNSCCKWCNRRPPVKF